MPCARDMPARARAPARKSRILRTPSSAVDETTCASRMTASSSTTTSPSPSSSSSSSSSSGLAAAAACSRVRPRRFVELCGPSCHAGNLWCHGTRYGRHGRGRYACGVRTVRGPLGASCPVPPVPTARWLCTYVSASRGTCSRASRPGARRAACTVESCCPHRSPRRRLRPRVELGSPSPNGSAGVWRASCATPACAPRDKQVTPPPTCPSQRDRSIEIYLS